MPTIKETAVFIQPAVFESYFDGIFSAGGFPAWRRGCRQFLQIVNISPLDRKSLPPPKDLKEPKRFSHRVPNYAKIQQDVHGRPALRRIGPGGG